jgi:hypothetical protein
VSVAVIRPDSWDFPLLVHVLGAMLLVGALILAASALIFAWRAGSVALLRLGYRALLFGAVPAWIVMRVGAQWIADKEDLPDSSWLGIGFGTGDGGIVFILVATILAGLAVRRVARAEGSGGGFRWTSAALVAVVLVAYLVTVWAMTAKPV